MPDVDTYTVEEFREATAEAFRRGVEHGLRLASLSTDSDDKVDR